MKIVTFKRWMLWLGVVLVLMGCSTPEPTSTVVPTQAEEMAATATSAPAPTADASSDDASSDGASSDDEATAAATDAPTEAPAEPTSPPPFSLTSPAFEHEGTIPAKFSCDGQDIAPALTWVGVPEGTESFVLIVDDPDAPIGTWVHWVVYNLPASTTSLPEGASANSVLPAGALEGQNGWKRADYGGPCPPRGEHRYFFKLYALDTTLDLDPGATRKADVEKAMKGHVLDEAILMGRYER
jgi:hypothetical protein